MTSTKEYTIADLLKLRYSTDEKADTFFQWEGSVFAFIPGQPPKKIFRCIGMNVSKAVIEDGKLKAFGKELLYYLDPVTGKKLDKWDNPWTGEEKLPVIHIANDPVQMALPCGISLDARYNKFDNTTAIVSEIPLFYPNPLATEDHKFDAYDCSKMYQAGEFFTFKCNTKELDASSTIDHVDLNWTRISRFAPFMKMGKSDGYLVYHCTGFKLPQKSTAQDLHPLLAKEIETEMKTYAAASDAFNPSVPNVSSWSYFRDHFDRYTNEPGCSWPICSLKE